MNYKTFADRFELIELNFNFKYSAKLLPLVYEQIKSMSDEEFNQGINRILSMTRTQWSEKYNYGKTPVIADWIELLSIECKKMMREARFVYSNHVFKNKTTIKVINSLANGIKTIHDDCFDPWNYNKKNKWVYEYRLVEKWLAFANDKHVENYTITSNNVKALLPNIKLNK